MRTNRREFLKKMAVATALANTMPFVGKSMKLGGSTKMKLGLVTYLWGKDWDLPTLIKNCETAGIAGVELRSTHAHGVEIDLTKTERKEVKKRFNNSKVKLVGLGSAEEYNHPEPERLKKAIEDTKAFITLSKDVGGTGVKVRPNRLYDDVPHEKTIEQIGKSLNEVGKFAADNGQNIYVEVHGKGTSKIEVMKAIFDHVTEKSVGICWNCNGQDLEGKGIEHNFNLLKSRFGQTVHVRELNVGTYPYQKLMDMFVEMDYSGWILLECRTKPEDRIAALKEQKKIWKEMIGA